jgi:C-terminal processing protease CtpA/Prc
MYMLTCLTGQVVALINEETISHAEHSCLYLESCVSDIVFVGSASNGANGNITNCSLPGGILVGFTGLGTLHASKAQLQRKGIQPHVLIEPTIEVTSLCMHE